MIRIGMKLQHIDPEADWHAEVKGIDGNDMKVTVSGKSGKWTETWNLAHAQTGLDRGDYVEIL